MQILFGTSDIDGGCLEMDVLVKERNVMGGSMILLAKAGSDGSVFSK
jgi:hypothetical protein